MVEVNVSRAVNVGVGGYDPELEFVEECGRDDDVDVVGEMLHVGLSEGESNENEEEEEVVYEKTADALIVLGVGVYLPCKLGVYVKEQDMDSVIDLVIVR